MTIVQNIRPRAETIALLEFDVHGRRKPLKIDKRGAFTYFVSHHFAYVGGPPDKYTDEELELLARASERLDAEWTSRRWTGGIGFDGDAGIYFDKEALDTSGQHYGWTGKRQSWNSGMNRTLPQAFSTFYRRELLRREHWACLADMIPRQVLQAEGVTGSSALLALDNGLSREYALEVLVLAAPSREELEEFIAIHKAVLTAQQAA